jgi:hypothetical protein
MGTLGPPNCPSCFSVALETRSAASDDRRWMGPISLAFRLIGVMPAKYLYLASVLCGRDAATRSHNSSESGPGVWCWFRVSWPRLDSLDTPKLQQPRQKKTSSIELEA